LTNKHTTGRKIGHQFHEDKNPGGDHKLKVFGRSDPGKERQSNEDNYYFKVYDDETAILAVADGMGGHAAGEVASFIAVDVLSRFALAEEAPGSFKKDTPEYIRDLINTINDEIFNQARDDPGKKGMGTTFTMGFISGKCLTIGHVGDSRAYHLSGKVMRRMTEDHTVVEAMIKDGRITREEAGSHPRRHVLTRALGTSLKVEVDILGVDVHEGDVLLFCTDGLTSLIEEGEIGEVILKHRDQPDRAIDDLISLANERGGHDNITLVLVVEPGGQNAG
jgi:protein phosphatase